MDGTNADLAGCPGDRGYLFAAWSPDGKVIAHAAELGESQLYLTDARRGAFASTRITDGTPQYFAPDWAPTADRLAAAFDDLFNDTLGPRVVTMNRDGTGNDTVRFSAASPAWSPDGNRIAFVDTPSGEVRTMKPDGSGETPVTAGADPDWQPLPVNGYPRPKGAYRQRIALVTAYTACAAPNRTHGPPLAFPACAPPVMESDHITVGTGDSNGLPAKFRGNLDIHAIPGTPQTSQNDADVRVVLTLFELFNRETLDSYTGEVQARFNVQITDRENSPHPGGPGPGTTVEIPFEMTAQTCVPGAPGSPPEGTSCLLVSELSAILPGAVKEGGRAIWQVDDVEVWDGGPDGDAETKPNTLFARQGVFVP